MPDSVKKNISINMTGDIKKQLIEIRSLLEQFYTLQSYKGKKNKEQIIKDLDEIKRRREQDLKEIDNLEENLSKKEENRKKYAKDKERAERRTKHYMEMIKESDRKIPSVVTSYNPLAQRMSFKSFSESYVSSGAKTELDALDKEAARIAKGGYIDKNTGKPVTVAQQKKDFLANRASYDAAQDKWSRTASTFTSINTAFNILGTVLRPVIGAFRTLSNEIIKTIRDFMSLQSGLATYSSNTLISNQTARESRLQWGLSASQYAGFNIASRLMNVKNEEDLYFMGAEQRNLFLEYFKRYSEYYEKLESSGVLRNIQKLQLEFEEFKMQISMEFLSWVSDNRVAILNTMNVMLSVLKSLGNTATKILNGINPLSNDDHRYYSDNQLYGSDGDMTDAMRGSLLSTASRLT